MAERRMFSKQITESDAFLEMPFSTQDLYFHLCMEADDDGFLNNSKKIQKVIGASEEDMKILIDKHFIIPFESGIIVIKHWKIHNYIQTDRYKPTTYTEEKEKLIVKTNRAYSLKSDSVMDTECIQNGYNVYPNCTRRLGKVSIDKNNKDNISEKEEDIFVKIPLKDNSFYSVYTSELEELQRNYPLLDVRQEILDMKAWCIDNPDKRKTPRGIHRFINHWLKYSKSKPEVKPIEEDRDQDRELYQIFTDCQDNYPAELQSKEDYQFFKEAIASESFDLRKEKAIRIKLKIRNMTGYVKPLKDVFREVLLC
ncbi:MAG: replisome organizer [Lachnospiraceae bacterium]|nr:replisome organizer [Lachnospiraceae bacterium]